MILGGDIGATNTRLAVFDPAQEPYERKFEQDFHSAPCSSLEEIVDKYLNTHNVKPQAACFGIPGVVRIGEATTTNLPWKVQVKELAKVIGTELVWLINDVESNAYGIPILAERDICTINHGLEGETGNAGLLSPGTGLGEAGLYWDGQDHRPFATEGSHTDFAPVNDQQYNLLQYLQKRYGHVSWERVISGMGLLNIYSFLHDTKYGADPDWLFEEIMHGDGAAAITHHALLHESKLCDATLDLFVSFLGAEAGNLALKLMARGGIYLGGGIAPKILDRLREPTFMQSFTAKGRFTDLLKNIPVRVILNEKTALLGAARYAYLHTGIKPRVLLPDPDCKLS